MNAPLWFAAGFGCAFCLFAVAVCLYYRHAVKRVAMFKQQLREFEASPRAFKRRAQKIYENPKGIVSPNASRR